MQYTLYIYTYICIFINNNLTQILLLYDHWDDSQMIFDGCYQIIFTTSFIARALHNIWNQDKVN